MRNANHMSTDELSLANKICCLIGGSQNPLEVAQVLNSHAVALAHPDLELAATEAVDMTRSKIEGFREFRDSLRDTADGIFHLGLEGDSNEAFEKDLEARIEKLDAELAAAESILAEAFTRICE